jgi:hypothetical protein
MRKLKVPSPAMVVALIALFVALGGTGYAARTAIFSSPTKAQIIRIVKRVAPTLNVKSAASLSTLPSGHSESGMFATGDGTAPTAGGGWIGVSISYPRPLPAAIPDANIINVAGTSAAHCPGPGHADPGFLCLYNTDKQNLGVTYFYSDDGSRFPAKMGTLGVMLYWYVTVGPAYAGGTWTVTAP